MNANGNNTVDKKIVFIQYDIPPLKAGEYTVTIKQDVKTPDVHSYSTTRKFAVTGSRWRRM